MKYVHFVLQGKGGAGKSFVASIIAQYLQELDPKNLALDTDPLNQSLYKIKGINCEFINILNANREDIDHTRFDAVIQRIIQANADHVVIDTGSNSFLQLSNYIKSQNIIFLLEELGYKAKFHFVVNGGSEQNEAIKLTIEFANILYHIENLQNGYYDYFKPLVIWLNPMPAPLKFNNAEDSIYDDACYQLLEPLINGIVHLPKYHTNGLVKSDIFSMCNDLLTFNEFIEQSFDPNNQKFNIVSQHRIKSYQRDIYTTIAPIFH